MSAGFFGYHALLFAALAQAPAPEANRLNYTWPLLIVLLSAPLLGLRLTLRHLLGVGTGLLGSLLLLAQRTNFAAAALLGYLCAVGAAVTWALYSVLAQRMRAVPTRAVIGYCAANAILAAAAHILFETTVVPDWQAGLAVVALGVGPVARMPRPPVVFCTWCESVGCLRSNALAGADLPASNRHASLQTAKHRPSGVCPVHQHAATVARIVFAPGQVEVAELVERAGNNGPWYFQFGGQPAHGVGPLFEVGDQEDAEVAQRQTWSVFPDYGQDGPPEIFGIEVQGGHAFWLCGHRAAFNMPPRLRNNRRGVQPTCRGGRYWKRTPGKGAASRCRRL